MMTDTSLDIDLATLVGPMDDMGCEHTAHDIQKQFHDDGPATHYVIRKSHCTGEDVLYAACAKWVRTVQSGRLKYICVDCRERGLPTDHVWVVGPVNK